MSSDVSTKSFYPLLLIINHKGIMETNITINHNTLSKLSYNYFTDNDIVACAQYLLRVEWH